MLPHVFDPFVQGDQSLERSQGGLGIGLTLVEKLVELHGGRVEVASEGQGRGAEVVIRLPALAALSSPLVDCVNQALADMKSDGTLDSIEQKWLSQTVNVPVLQ